MSASFPNGTIFSLGTTYAAAKTITAITNANPGVATSTSHGYTSGDILLLSMPSRLDSRVVRVDNELTNTFELEGVNTTSTTRYPSGFGVGTAVEVTAWTSLSQVADSQSTGGEQQFYQWTYLEDARQRQRPTFKNARALTLTMDYDPALSWHDALVAADEAGSVYALRAVLPTGVTLYYGVYVGFDGQPTLTINQNMQTTCTFALASDSTRYSA